MDQNVIPRIIWQTYENDYEDLSTYMQEWSNSWKMRNTNWEYRYMNAQEREDFVLKYFGSEWHILYKSCPINVMRADIWRYMILYIYGGFYVDIDTVCKVPIDSWLNYKHSFIVSDDLDNVFNNAAILSSKNNPIILSILEEVKNNLLLEKYEDKFFVYHTTGCAAMTKGILNALEIDHNLYKSSEYDKLNNVEKAKKYGFYCFDGRLKMFQGSVFEQLNGSTYWNTKEYPSWQKEVEIFLHNKGI